MSEIITLGAVGFNLKGEYNSELQYERLDVVLYNGVSYAAKQNVTGQLPTNTTYWDALGVSGADMSDYYTKTQTDNLLNEKADKNELPTKTSDLTNDSDFTTKAYVDGLVGNIGTILDNINGEIIGG